MMRHSFIQQIFPEHLNMHCIVLSVEDLQSNAKMLYLPTQREINKQHHFQ